MSTLIVYASKYGCTEKCANLIKKELRGQVDIMNLKNVKDIDLSAYDRVIIGGSVYIGKVRKEVTVFCSNNLNKLAGKRIGLFLCGMAEGEAINTELNGSFPPELLKMAHVKEFVGGEFILDKMSFLDKTIVKKVSKTTSNKSNILVDKIHEFAQAMN